MKYIELTVHTATEGSELVADAMWAYSPYGVTVCDAADAAAPYGVTVCDAADAAALAKDSTVFWDYMDENVSSENRDVLVKCYLEPSEAEEKIKLILGEIASRKERSEGAIDFGSLEETKREIEGDDWIDVWKNASSSCPSGSTIKKRRAKRSSTSIPTWRSARANTRRPRCASNSCKNT